MTAPAIIQDLVNRFRDSRELYRSGRYNEAQLRLEFLNPFFEALGWDMVNRSNFAPQYREVIHEDSLEVEGSAKAPDYAFRIGTTRKFFVEAKKPKVNIRYEIDPAYQLRRYAWNAHLPLSILTDFEELAVYDCRTRPDPKDSAATGRVMLFTYEEYLTRWDELAGIFSKDAVWNGSFDRYAEGSKGKRGTTEVDAEFLKEIEEWRILLARNIALRNFRSSAAADPTLSREGDRGAKSPELAEGSGFQTVKASEAKQPPSLHRAERQLNYAVQTTIDRILFLRICEDRQIEPTDQLLQIAGGSDIYAHLLVLFQKADQKYNSGLFHFGKEKGQTSEPDSFTPSLVIDDKVLRQIIKSTYFPCPYIFNEIPVEILGQVYEQFLGKVIRLTPGGQAKVEEKPEVRKAGGVYYTPRYIVDYIVQNTLGRLLGDNQKQRSTPSREGEQGGGDEAGVREMLSEEEGLESSRSEPVRGVPTNASGVGVLRNTGTNQKLTPTQALNLRVVDPACGSGSFLLGAFQYLLDWHLNYYLSHDPQSHTRGKNPPLVVTEGGEYRLTTETKKRILTSNIYGVDIDSQAVEVTKLSLLLKLLEGETGQLSLGFERVLPDLGNNIRCGNSLIGWDYFHGQMFPDEEEIQRVNPFDWQRAFPHVFAEGGFDAVIGNPPYIRIQSIREWAPKQADYYKSTYLTATKGNFDIYVVFVEKSLSIINSHGVIGFIIPNKFISVEYGEGLRSIIAKRKALSSLVDFGDFQVFNNATTYTCILILLAEPQSEFRYRLVRGQDKLNLYDVNPFVSVDGGIITDKPWLLKSSNWQYFVNSIKNEYLTLEHTEKMFVGLQTSSDSVYIVDSVMDEGETLLVYSKAIDTDIRIESEITKPILKGSEISRYLEPKHSKVVIFPYQTHTGKAIPVDIRVMKNKYPLTHQYLMSQKKNLINRAKTDESNWWLYPYPKNLLLFNSPKILIQVLSTRGNFSWDPSGKYAFVGGGTAGAYAIFVDLDREKYYKYLLGILNSKFTTYFASKTSSVFRGGYFVFGKSTLKNLPMPPMNETIMGEMCSLVDRMLLLRNSDCVTPQEKQLVTLQMMSIDNAIDSLVYEAYHLTSSEIEAIESEFLENEG